MRSCALWASIEPRRRSTGCSMNHARAILWAQWRTLRNCARGGAAWTAVIGVIWYGFWLLASAAGANLVANPANLPLLKVALAGTLLIVFLYWQVVPLLMAATGASLDLRKLQVYPIPVSQLFAIEVMLRVTAGIEMLMVLCGIALGIAFNPKLPLWCALAVFPYMLFNLFLAIGVRDMMLRLMARRKIREVVVFLLVDVRRPASIAALARIRQRPPGGCFHPGLLAGLAVGRHRESRPRRRLSQFQRHPFGWTVVAALFGRWQFNTTLSFDKEAAAANDNRPSAREGIAERFFRLPSTVLSRPSGGAG